MSDGNEELRVRVNDMERSFSDVKTLIAMREERSRTTGEKVDRLYEVLIGAGEKEKPSIVVRVDRLEQAEESRKWLWVGTIGLLFNAAWEWLKGSGGHGG